MFSLSALFASLVLTAGSVAPVPLLASDVVAIDGADGGVDQSPPVPPTPADAGRGRGRGLRDPSTEQERERRDGRGRRGRAVQESRETHAFKLSRGASLSVSNLAGRIVITGVAGNEASVAVVRRAYAETDDEARQELESAEVNMEQRGNRLNIRANQPSVRSRVTVDFTIMVPDGTMVDVHSLSGSIMLTDLKKDVRAETISGNIVAMNLAALVAAKTMSGTVQLSACTTDSELAASSVSGALTATNVKARDCSFASISGGVMLKDVVCERASARAVTGGLTFDGTLSGGGRYEFTTHSGDVNLIVDGRTGFDLDARSFNGELHSDLPLKSHSNASAAGRTMEGVYGDGSAGIKVTTFSGNITIAKQP
jgi:DUF4097 and DUF4098 domain-containing protein YvlB